MHPHYCTVVAYRYSYCNMIAYSNCIYMTMNILFYSLGGVKAGEPVVCALAKQLQNSNLQWLQ